MFTKKGVKIFIFIALAIGVGLGSLGITSTAYAAPPCYGSGCSWKDPDTSGPYAACWNTAYVANAGYNGSLTNYNYYTAHCNANFSYTYYPSPTWLMAQSSSVGGSPYYEGTQTWRWVWNLMIDGSNYVWTRGGRGPYKGYYPTLTPWKGA